MKLVIVNWTYVLWCLKFCIEVVIVAAFYIHVHVLHYSTNQYFFINFLISSANEGYVDLLRLYSLFNDVLCFHSLIIISKFCRFRVFLFFLFVFLMHS